MVSIPFYYVARDVIGFLRSLQPATKLPGADAGREEKVNSPLFEITCFARAFRSRCPPHCASAYHFVIAGGRAIGKNPRI